MLTYEDHGGVIVTLSDEGMRRLAAENAAKRNAARRNEIATGAVAAAATFFAIVELLKQVGGL